MNMAAASVIGSALILLAAIGTPTLAQDKEKGAAKHAATTKTILENDHVRVIETTWKPGDEAPSAARGARVVRSLKGGTLTRVYPDGKTEKVTSKDGEVRWYDPTPAYALKNETKSTISLYSVYPKSK